MKKMARLGPDRREGYIKVETVEGYDKWAPTYDAERNPLITLEEDITLDFISDVKNQKVLDIGCGTGRYCKLLAKRGAKVVGIDPSPRMLEFANRKITPDCRFELHLGKLEDVEFPCNHFDVIVSALTLGHIPQLEPVIRELSRLLKNRGRLIVSDIHPFWPVSGHDYTEFFDGSGQEYRIPQYTHLFEEYWNLCRKFGLSIEEVREPRINDRLARIFPGLEKYKEIPLAMILKAQKERQTADTAEQMSS
jgi:ubiquinone/menaquinone biosynthesis C-methylase UbiE